MADRRSAAIAGDVRPVDRQVPVSVVVPCYRCAATLGRAIESVFAQTALPLEIIAVDDASQDGTLEVLRGFERESGPVRMRVLALPSNCGPAAARNAGWGAARGEFVAFLDSDDSWLPRKLELQYAFMQLHPEFAITGHRALYKNEGLAPDGESRPVEWHAISPLSVLLRNPMVTPSLMVRRAATLRYDPARRFMEDHAFLQDAVFSGIGVARIERVLASVHKPAYGAGGLSGNLWAMEKGDLANYRALWRERRIGAAAFIALAAYSLLKFVRRAASVALRPRQST